MNAPPPLRSAPSAARSEPDWYYETNAAEWSCINRNYQCFAALDSFVDELYEIFYEGELEDVALDDMDSEQLWGFISNFFVDASVSVTTRLKAEGFFANSLFQQDLLLGLQFTDPDVHAYRMMEAVSSRVNSPHWHEKIATNCQRGLAVS